METFILCAAIILFNNQLLHATSVPSYPVRLTGGSNVYEGQIEVLYCVSSFNCTWRPVCASTDWDDNNIIATITCRQLGLYSHSAPLMARTSIANADSNAVVISCFDSTYNTLEHCSINITTPCESMNRVEVQCSSPPQISSIRTPSFSTMTASSTLATIQWTIGTGGHPRTATKYQVRCYHESYYSLNTTSTSTITLILEPCTLYTCCVGGIDIDGAIGEVKCKSFRTPISLTKFNVSGLEYTEVQSRSVTLQWNRLRTRERCNPPILYSVRVEGCNGIEANTTNTHTTITGLCPHSLYNISVKACNDTNKCGEYSAALSVHTLEDVPTNVNNVMCRALSSKQVNITWEPPTQTNGVIRFYEVILNNINTTQNTTKYVESYTTTATLSHLHPNHHYRYSVAVYSSVGRNTSAAQYVTLPQSSPTGVPEQFSCSQQSPTSLQLEWSPPHPLEQNGPIENYSVIVWNLDSNEVVYSNFTSYSSLTIHSLTSYHNYECAVAANGEFGLGPFDDRQVWISQTNHTFGPPSNLQVDHLTSNSFRVTWSEPTVRYNVSVHVDNYQIQVFDYQENRTVSGPTFTRLYYYEQRSLHPNYRYQIEVSAIVAGVQGPVAAYSVQTDENATPLKVDAIVYPILSVVFIAVVILLILANLRLSWRIQKMKKTYKVQREVAQDDDRVNNGEVIETTLPLESISTFSDSEKKVKPPAVLPKTYLEPKTSEIETPRLSDDSDVDNYSVGSDSLYDLRLEIVDFQLPQRFASQIARKPPRAIQGDKMPPQNLPRIRAKSTGPPKSSKSVQITKEEGKDRARTHSNEADQDYQKLDPKVLTPPNRYTDLNDLPSKPRHAKTTKEGSDTIYRHASTGQETLYEPLRLKAMNKPSEYQQIGHKN